MTRRSTIGIDRNLELAWLDATAAQVAAGRSVEAIREYLFELLADAVAGEEARKKTITVLTRIWGPSANDGAGLQARAVARLEAGKLEDRLGLHWTLLLARYPFFVDVTSAVGRLLRLQGEVALAQLIRRMAADWGDRSTVRRAVRRIVRSLVHWGVLADSETRGLYHRGRSPRPVPDELAILLVEALLLDSEREMVPLDQLTAHPSLFPFTVVVNANQIRSAEHLVVHREGLDMDLVGVG